MVLFKEFKNFIWSTWSKRSYWHHHSRSYTKTRISLIHTVKKMKKSELEIESISFYPNQSYSTTKTLQIKFTISGTSLKTQLPIFKEGNLEQLLQFLYKFNQAKNKVGYMVPTKSVKVWRRVISSRHWQSFLLMKSRNMVSYMFAKLLKIIFKKWFRQDRDFFGLFQEKLDVLTYSFIYH